MGFVEVPKTGVCLTDDFIVEAIFLSAESSLKMGNSQLELAPENMENEGANRSPIRGLTAPVSLHSIRH